MEHFRQYQGETNLVVTLPWGETALFTRIPGVYQKGQVVEIRWNYMTQGWEAVRIRNKEANVFDTVVKTVQNIIEDIQVYELV